MGEEICIFHSPWCPSLWLATGSSSDSELAAPRAQDRMLSLSLSLWGLRLRGGEPGATAIDDASDVDS